MGFFKKIFSDAADELKKNLEDAKKEMLSNLEEVKQDVMAGFTNSISNSRDYDEEDDEEPKILLGDFHDGVLTIREGITELDDESLEHYKRIRKIIFPASLERLDSNVIDEQERLEELDFSKVTKLKTIPDDFISGENKIRKLIIPNGVTEVGDGFLGEAKSGSEIFVPASVRKLGYITGNNDNDMTVYLFAANIDISDVEQDVKTLYVLPDYYGYYAKQLKECYSEASLREMPDDKMDIYGEVSKGTPTEKTEESNQQKQNSAPAVDEAKPEEETKAEAKEEIEQKEEPIENGGLFSARLEGMITAALQDGVLTDKERELLKRRAEKEGEDWDEVEMIIEARLAEMKPVVSAPTSEATENNTVSKDTAPKNNQNTVPQDNSSKADNEYPEEYLKKMKITAICSFINRKLYDIDRGKLSARSKIDAYRYLHILSEHAPDIELSVASFITCAEFYETAGPFDNPEAKIRDFLRFSGEPYVRTNEDEHATSIDIPEGVTIIPDRCFSECKSLVNITLPSTIKKIGKKAFYYCSSLISIDIPEGVTIIPKNCFYGCSSLESVTLPSTIKQIEEHAFYGCSSLISIDIPEGVSILPDWCFGECSRLGSITLPTTIKKIEKCVFYTCYKMKTISIPNGCERIEELSLKKRDNNIEELFLPPTLCAVDVICGKGLNVYCFAPYLEDLHPFVDGWTEVPVYVLPKYFDSYKSQAEAEGLDPRFIHIMPDEYLYFYDN